MSKRDYYEILEVTKTAEFGEIKSAYRKLALKYHPDRNPGDKSAEERFKEASEAYEVLSDSEKRSTYDRFGHQGLSGQGFSGFGDVNDIFSSFGSIFEEFFGFSSGGRSRHQRGSDLRYDLEIDFVEGVFGIEKEIEFERMVSCRPCAGSGAKEGTERKACRTCGGIGQVRRSQGFFSVQMACPDCRGQGSVVETPCAECRGRGVTREKRKLNVKVPAGVEEGIRLRVSGEGEAGPNGGSPGDLYVVLSVRESEHFEREGNDIIFRQSVGIAQAALGCKLKIPTLEDERTIEVPAGTQHGNHMTIPGLGVPRLRGLGRGDFHVIFEIKVPKKLTKVQKDLLQKFADEYQESTESNAGIFQRMFHGDRKQK